jgi:hypothetical protein
MPINIKLQDFTATIHKTSQLNNGQFDLIHVETLIVTDQPMPQEEVWYVPNQKPIDASYKATLEANHTNPQPMSGTEMNKRISDFQDAIQKAQEGNDQETKEDMDTLALLHVLSKTNLKPIESTSNAYILSYDYRLYPISQNTFEFQVVLPFNGLIIGDNGDEVQITVVAPIGAVIDQQLTKGIDTNGNQIPPQYAGFPTSRKQAVSFDYRIDPTFTVRYHY